MKKILLSFFSFTSTFLFAQNKDYPVQALPFNKVKLTDNFWLPRLKINAIPLPSPHHLKDAKKQAALKIL